MTDQKTELIKKLITALTEFIALAESEENKAPQPAGDGRLEMLTLKECAALVPGLSVHTVRKLALQGKVPSVRTGEGKNGKILISKQALLSYLSGGAA